MRRTAFVLALVALPGHALADSFVEVAGGVMIPVEDDDWTNYVESGPKLSARVGGASDGSRVGGMFSADWSPLTTDDMGFGNAVEVGANRFRLLISAFSDERVGSKLAARIRIGGGIDITHVTIDTNLGPFSSNTSDTDVGIALEAAGGLWFSAGSVQIGGELALPLSFHADDTDDDIDLDDYTSFDIDLLFGVRFVSR